MVKHGISHASAAMVCVLAGNMLSQKLGELLPTLHANLAHYCSVLIDRFGIGMNTDSVINLFLITLFSFAWGVAFRAFNQGR